MGSMTGAPKRRVMELIDQYERSGRGIFSGAVGYITPTSPLNSVSKWGGEKGKGVVWGQADFDFNVVIRSIMYNASEKYLSFMAGSGITFYSDAENEYDECLMKSDAMRRVLVE
jgi:para-aminobenzoate synthetase component 1